MISRKPPKETFLHGKTAYDVNIVKIGPLVRHVLCTWRRDQKETQKTLQWQTGYSPRPPTLSVEIKFCIRGSLRGVVVLRFKFYQNRLSGFRDWNVWSKSAFFHCFGHWLIQQIVMPYKLWCDTDIACSARYAIVEPIVVQIVCEILSKCGIFVKIR